MPITAPAPGRNAFADPRTGDLDLWEFNHNEEQSGARLRTITNLQPTGARFGTVRAIRQQGGRDGGVYKLAGRAPSEAQHRMFLRYMALSLRQSIYFFHAAGEAFECRLSDYEPQRQYVPRGPRGEHYIYIYAIQLDVLRPL